MIIDVLFLHRALGNKFDDLNSKSREAEKEVNMLQMKIEEVNNNLYPNTHSCDIEKEELKGLEKIRQGF